MPNPKAIGERSEGIVLGELCRLGKVVLLPFGNNQRYDLVVDEGDRFVRVQVKTAYYKGGCVLFKTNSVNAFTGERRTYNGQIDVFMAYSAKTDKIYIVPVEECGPSGFCLRVEPTKSGQRAGVRWAKDYELK